MRSEERMRRFAAKRYGVVTRDELEEMGISRRRIQGMLQRGELALLMPNVYAIGGAPSSWHQRLYAASRWGGDRAVVSHRAAAKMWKLAGVRTAPVEITIVGGVKRPPQGVVVHSTKSLDRCDVRSRHQMWVTDPTRTAIDLPAVVGRSVAEMALDDVVYRGLTSPGRLVERLSRLGAKGRNGIAVATEIVDSRTKGGRRESELERRLRRLIADSDLPRPVIEHEVRLPDGRRFFLDVAYPDLRVDIEGDGYKWHGSYERWKRDNDRDVELHAEGWIVLRFTWYDVTVRPDWIIDRIRRVLQARLLIA